MLTSRADRHVHLFTLRLWMEEESENQGEMRGRIYDATTGDVRYFRDWASLIPLLLVMMQNGEQRPPTRHSTSLDG